MSFNEAPWMRRPPAKPDRGPAPPTLSQLALAEMRKAELDSREFGSHGEWCSPQPQPTVEQPASWRPPPPDWAEEEQERLQREHEEHALAEELPAAHPPPTREEA